ncbi:bifunctional serine/threonine-protein kinase/glutamate ABC transporter substrate-binding protein [Nonomuraea sp. LPB2021202275-12-8]|uniref:bifunctional serine/threonine-protein kinase/glutamate ABC transporter substrate-binding protein n=1 Tax=Nonomuraea sp. LPB2021202275-12-8 TaxID=3120159 RepID=UPI00300C5D27
MPQISPLLAGDPTQLGSFRLSGRIGEGGQGIVFLGVNEQDERAAVKLLHMKFSGDTIARSRFGRELKAAKRVASFCTARVMEADLDGDTPYIASEYIEGPALRDIVDSEGPLRGTVLDRLAIGTATALTAIHHASIVHRDLKPDNVLIAADGPRVVDFGIARIIDSTGTITSRAIGTPAYMAPEQIAGDEVGPYTDVFAWGATIAFAATGKSVFEGNSIASVLNRILNHEVDVSMMPEPLRGVVRSALAKSPAERPSADQILLRLLGQPETVGASTAVLNRGVQVASDDTTPFMRISPTLAPQTGSGPLRQQTGSGPLGRQTGSGPLQQSTAGVAQQETDGAAYPQAPSRGGDTVAPARRGRGRWWAALVVALALAAAGFAVAVANGWPPLAFGQRPEPGPSGGDVPPTYSSVADKVARTGKIVIGVKGDLPGVGLTRAGGFEGFDVDLAQRIATELRAKETEFVAVSRADRASALADGKVDLVVATYSINDGDDVEFAGPYYLAHQDLLVRHGSIDSVDDLKGKRICAINSPSVGTVQDRVKVEPVPAGNYAECMDLLRSGKVDAVPGDDLILAGFASRENQRFKVLGAKLNDERYGIGLKEGDVKTCKAINGVIADLYRTGFIEQLMTKHFANVEFTPESKVPAMKACG